MTVSITPVLSSTVSYLTDVRDQIMSVVRFAIMNPGRISSLWEDKLISCRVMAAKYEHDRTKFVNEMTVAFDELFSKKFTDYNIQTNFTAEDTDPTNPNGQFAMNFDITIVSRRTGKTSGGILKGALTIDSTTRDIHIDFSRSQDSSMI